MWKKQIKYFPEAGYSVTAWNTPGNLASLRRIKKPDFECRLRAPWRRPPRLLMVLDLWNVNIFTYSMTSSVPWKIRDKHPDECRDFEHFVIVEQFSILVADPDRPIVGRVHLKSRKDQTVRQAEC